MTPIEAKSWSALERRLAILASFAAAAVDLKERDAEHRLRDVQVSLAEDNQTVTVFSNWSDDAAALCSSFTLPEPVAEEDFDADRWRKLLES